MSKLGYFLGGALVGVIGTAVAACAIDAYSSSSSCSGTNQELDVDESNDEETVATVAESFSEPAGEASQA